ncbi:hypothetical protein Acsp01_16120 [Actinoplanes sp. NBRC 101535]|nr:hypothetical protein Acsp01_16120 [Actinoplanes sp. NBRC 101535]
MRRDSELNRFRGVVPASGSVKHVRTGSRFSGAVRCDLLGPEGAGAPAGDLPDGGSLSELTGIRHLHCREPCSDHVAPRGPGVKSIEMQVPGVRRNRFRESPDVAGTRRANDQHVRRGAGGTRFDHVP